MCRVADGESEFIEMTRLCASIYGVALIAWMALAAAEAQNLAPPPTRLPRPGMPGQPAVPTQELQALPGQQPIQPQINSTIQRNRRCSIPRRDAGFGGIAADQVD